MYKKVGLLVLMLTFFMCQSVFAASGTVTASSLNVRSSASTSASILGTLSKNIKVDTLGLYNDFYKISYKGKIGYISSSYVKIVTVLSPVVQNIPILMYHKIEEESSETDGLIVGKKDFSSQMNYLKINGYTTISLDQLYDFMSKGTALPNNPVAITFDDGYANNYTLAYPVLKANKQQATVFMIGKDIDKNKESLTSKQIKEMDANGFRVENHTFRHDDLAKLTYEKQLETLTLTKIALEEILGRKVNYIAYPYGSYNTDTLKAAKKSECLMGISTEAGLTSKNDGMYAIDRIFMGPLDNLTTMKRKLSTGK
jgi:peptidoglycan/xylan/chitin deacetylase (PgdA/CDA1 family)